MVIVKEFHEVVLNIAQGFQCSILVLPTEDFKCFICFLMLNVSICVYRTDLTLQPVSVNFASGDVQSGLFCGFITSAETSIDDHFISVFVLGCCSIVDCESFLFILLFFVTELVLVSNLVYGSHALIVFIFIEDHSNTLAFIKFAAFFLEVAFHLFLLILGIVICNFFAQVHQLVELLRIH